jgi:hypothetical protein
MSGRKPKGTETYCTIASSKENIPIDATASVSLVVDEIVRQSEANE